MLMELLVLNNTSSVSCISEGVYDFGGNESNTIIHLIQNFFHV